MKRTLSLIACCILLSLPALAGGIRFTENKKWKDVLALAARENKIIFLDAYASWCGPCNYMRQTVFTQPMVGDYYNSRFINVAMDMEKGEGPQLDTLFGVKAYPSFYFISPKGELLHSSVGALNAVAFLELGRDATDPSKQLYTQQHRAERGELAPAAMEHWLIAASGLGNTVLDSTAARYIRRAGYPLLDTSMLHIALNYGVQLSRMQVDFLFAHRDEVGRRMGYASAELQRSLLRKLRGYALSLSTEAGAVDEAAYNRIVGCYAPADAAVEGALLRMRAAFGRDDGDSAMSLFIRLLGRPEGGLFTADITETVFGRIEAIAPHARACELMAALRGCRVRPDEAQLAYSRELAVLAIALKQKNAPVVRQSARLLYDDPLVPEGLRREVSPFLDYR